MAQKIDQLSADQAKLLTEWQDEWLRLGTCCEPADRDAVEAAVIAMYAEIGLSKPKFLWTQSPAAALDVALRQSMIVEPFVGPPLTSKGAAFLLNEKAVRNSIGGRLGPVLWDALQQALNRTLHASLEDAFGERLWRALWYRLERALEASIDSLLRRWLFERTGTIANLALVAAGEDPANLPVLAHRANLLLGASGRVSTSFLQSGEAWQLRWAFRGQHDANWVAFYLFCEKVLGVRYAVEHSRQLGLWGDLSRNGGWWAPYDKFCICAERPSVVRMEQVFDDAASGGFVQRLHCADGPALAFRDGIAIHVVHGALR